LHQICSSQIASSLQFTTFIKSAVHNLQQACSSQLAASLLTTCNRLDIIKPEQAMRTHPVIGLMIASCIRSAADLLQLARFWLCIYCPLSSAICNAIILTFPNYLRYLFVPILLRFTLSFVYKVYIGFFNITYMHDWIVTVAQYIQYISFLKYSIFENMAV
jgi:hypothetical protein